MEGLFRNILEISIMASFLIVAVIFIRLCFRKASAGFKCMLWMLVGIRLLIPMSISVPFSLVPEINLAVEGENEVGTEQENILGNTQAQKNETFGVNMGNPLPGIIYEGNGNLSGAMYEGNGNLSGAMYEGSGNLPGTMYEENGNLSGVIYENDDLSGAGYGENSLGQDYSVLAVVWLVGVAVMLGYMVLSGLRLRNSLQMATPDRVAFGETSVKIYRDEHIVSPFLLGMVSPKIYVPCGIGAEELKYVLAHELTHVRRRDHLLKPFSFLVLSVYWFHPLVWVAYIFLNRDIESACDERVVREQPAMDRAAYAKALLSCASNQCSIAVCPVAFGESDVKKRVKNVLHYKKPGFWTLIACAVLAVVVVLCFMTVSEKSDMEKVDDLQAEQALAGTEESKQSTDSDTENAEQATSGVSASLELSGLLTMEKLLEWTSDDTLEALVEEKGIEAFLGFENLTKAESPAGALRSSYYCDFEYLGGEYQLQIVYETAQDSTQKGQVVTINMTYFPSYDKIVLYSTYDGYQIGNLAEFVERPNGFTEITYTLPEGFTFGDYNTLMYSFKGALLEGDVEEVIQPEGSTVAWHGPGGIALIDSVQKEHMMTFENGELTHVFWDANHQWQSGELEKVEGCFTAASITTQFFDVFTIPQFYEYQQQHPDVEWEDVTATYWYVYIGDESSENMYLVFLNKKFFTKEDAIAFAQSIKPKE